MLKLMKKILHTINKYLKDNKFPVIGITIVTFFVWYKILFQTPNGEGFMYFSHLYSLDPEFLNLKFLFQEHSLLARTIFTVLMPILKNNIVYYMAFQLAIMCLVYQTLYFVLVKITKDKTVSFLAAIFWGANYVGSLTMLGLGSLHRFAQRVPNIIPLLVSFYFLTRYLEKGKKKELILAYSTYVLFIALSHINVFFLPIFATYPLVYTFLNKKRIFSLKIIFLSSLFILSPVLITRGDSLSRPNYSPLTFIKETPNVIQMILYQISSVSFPQQITIFVSKHVSPPIPYPYLQTQNFVLVFIAIVFILSLIKGRKYPKLLILFTTFGLSLPILSFLTVYAYDVIPNPMKFFDEDRIYFFQSIFIAFIWAACIKFFFGRNKTIYIAMVFLITSIFLIDNTSLIWNGMEKYQYRSNMYKTFIEYVKSLSLSSSFNDKTVIVAPADLIRTTDPFIRRFYNLKTAKFIVLEDGWKNQVSKISPDKKDVFVLDYKYDYDVRGENDPKSVQIIDKSEDFRLDKDIIPFVKPRKNN